jgi:hypothetical protein
MGSYYYITSWLVLRTDATRDLQWTILIHIREPPGMRRPGSPSQVVGYGEQVVKSCPPALNRRVEE